MRRELIAFGAAAGILAGGAACTASPNTLSDDRGNQTVQNNANIPPLFGCVLDITPLTDPGTPFKTGVYALELTIMGDADKFDTRVDFGDGQPPAVNVLPLFPRFNDKSKQYGGSLDYRYAQNTGDTTYSTTARVALSEGTDAENGYDSVTCSAKADVDGAPYAYPTYPGGRTVSPSTPGVIPMTTSPPPIASK